MSIRLLMLFFMSFSFVSNAQNTEWQLVNLLREKSKGVEICGNPQIVDSPFGKAVSFDGIDDALFLNEMPLDGLKEFTVEMIFKPEVNAPFEQRVLHIGESREDRMLLEIRAVDSSWYFDAFAVSGTNKKPLADEKQLHPLGQWYHAAFVVTPKSLTTYINGKQELHEDFSFLPIKSGRTSIGVRLNKVSWFKGDIYKIRITPRSLQPNGFMNFKN